MGAVTAAVRRAANGSPHVLPRCPRAASASQIRAERVVTAHSAGDPFLSITHRPGEPGATAPRDPYSEKERGG